MDCRITLGVCCLLVDICLLDICLVLFRMALDVDCLCWFGYVCLLDSVAGLILI